MLQRPDHSSLITLIVWEVRFQNCFPERSARDHFRHATSRARLRATHANDSVARLQVHVVSFWRRGIVSSQVIAARTPDIRRAEAHDSAPRRERKFAHKTGPRTALGANPRGAAATAI